MSKNYKISLESYIKVDRTSKKIEYSWIECCGILIDGGIIENDNVDKLTDEEIIKMITDRIALRRNLEIKEVEEEIEEINPLVFRDENSKIPLTRNELAEIYWNGDKEQIEKHGYPSYRFALYSAECKCNGHGRFILEETPEDKKKNHRIHYIRCKNCGERSYL